MYNHGKGIKTKKNTKEQNNKCFNWWQI